MNLINSIILLAIVFSFSSQSKAQSVISDSKITFQADLKNPTELAMSDRAAAVKGAGAALTDDGIIGWGGTELPPVGLWQNPRMLRLGGVLDYSWGSNLCAVVNHRIHCWLRRNGQSFEKTYGPEDPDDYVISSRSLCVLKSGTITCPTGDDASTKIPTDLIGVRQFGIAYGDYDQYGCAVVNQGVRCWGALPSGVPSTVAEEGFQSVSLGRDGMCALKANSFKCWGDYFGSGVERTAPGLRQLFIHLFRGIVYQDNEGVKVENSGFSAPAEVGQPRLMASTPYESMCAITNDTVRCWKKSW